MKRNTYTTLWSVFFFLCAYTAFAAERPNFVVIFTDDQGYADLSCFGGEHVATPFKSSQPTANNWSVRC